MKKAYGKLNYTALNEHNSAQLFCVCLHCDAVQTRVPDHKVKHNCMHCGKPMVYASLPNNAITRKITKHTDKLIIDLTKKVPK